MRLRHRQWSEKVLEENKDISRDLSDFDPELIPTYQNLEIGSGCGGFLIEISKRHPETRFLGVEINKNAFAIAVKKAAEIKKDQTNFLILNAPIERIFPLITDHQLENIYLNFSDPWPKKKQKHRRLTYPTRLKEYFRMLKPDGTLYFRTDNIDLFNDTIEYFNEVDLYNIEIIQPFYSETVNYLPPTEYETKFREKGVQINVVIAKPKK